MNAYNDVDGTPCAADAKLLTDLLRDTWGFTGTVVSDYWSIAFLASMHHVASDLPDAARQALHAGIDVELPHTAGYGAALALMAEDGRIPADILDRAVLRVLTQKAEMGLLDQDWAPDQYRADDLNSDRNRAVARRMAEQSVVLLDNHAGLLPLQAPRSITVIGPAADDSGCLFGCYSFPNHVLPHHPGLALGVDAPTVLDAIRREFPDAEVRYTPGCTISGPDRSGIQSAVEAAEAADVTVLVVGDRSGMFGNGTSGEGCDVAALQLPGVQEELAEAVLAAAQRTVLLLISGRPYAIGRHSDAAEATVQAFFPGQEGGTAIAGVLSGRVNPSGRLPVQIPGENSGQPGTYLAPSLALKSDGVSNIDPTPAFPFGHGLSYSAFRIDDVRATASEIPTDGTVVLRATVSNVSNRAGTAVPQLYLTDPVASVTRPVRQLIGFARVDLQASESRTLQFTVSADLAGFTGRDLRRRVEPGRLILTVAQSATDRGTVAAVRLTGETRYLDHRRAMAAEAQLLD